MKYDLSFDEMNFETDVALSVDMPVYDLDLLTDVREATGSVGAEEDPEFCMRVKNLYDAAKKLHQKLRTKIALKVGKFSSLVRKAVSTFSAHSRVRAHSSPARSRSNFETHDNDDGGDSDGSGDPDPPLPAKRSYHLTFSKPKFQENSFAITVVSHRQSQYGLSFFKKGRAA